MPATTPLQGGAGNDLFVASQGDGNDTYYGDDMAGGCGSGGNDTLDMAAITANITVDLGTGFLGRGSASSSQSGTDMLWGIENVVTGSGDDTITAAQGGERDGRRRRQRHLPLPVGGRCQWRHDPRLPAGRQDRPLGDRRQLPAPGNHTFTLVTGSGFNAAGALLVTHETRDGEDYTIVEGNTNGGSDAEFKISIKGNHNLTSDDFNL